MAKTRARKPKASTRKRATRRPPAVPRAEAVVRCSDLRKRFGDVVAVDGVGFEIAAGETYGLLGPNGAGKTTTVSMLCGLLDSDGGVVVVAGDRMDPNATRAKAHIGYVPQDIALYPDLTGRENLRFFGRLYGLRGDELDRRIDRMLETVGLSERADDRVDNYSGGMKRRMNIAAGLLHDPSVLVLDEPTVGVDPQSRNAILESVSDLAKAGMAVLYTTHYMEEAERLCDRVGIIDEGKIIAEGTRRELVASVGQRDRVQLAGTGPLARFATQAKRLKDVADATVGDGTVQLLVRSGRDLLAKVLEIADRAGVQVTSVDVVEPDLEAVFLHLTGKALRD
ncbi:MAG TPA: ABC transporter ATP-binding protein [Actinomycetota bacterium]|nr:ABC transporter ATP-binding protein [Actinomycetota bacterium]